MGSGTFRFRRFKVQGLGGSGLSLQEKKDLGFDEASGYAWKFIYFRQLDSTRFPDVQAFPFWSHGFGKQLRNLKMCLCSPFSLRVCVTIEQEHRVQDLEWLLKEWNVAMILWPLQRAMTYSLRLAISQSLWVVNLKP